jgi:hypothetical protein
MVSAVRRDRQPLVLVVRRRTVAKVLSTGFAGRLYRIAQALDTDVGYFFEGAGKVMRCRHDSIWSSRPDRRLQEQIVALARALADSNAGPPGF